MSQLKIGATSAERRMVDQTGASWNRIVVWLRQLGQWQEAGWSPCIGSPVQSTMAVRVMGWCEDARWFDPSRSGACQ